MSEREIKAKVKAAIYSRNNLFLGKMLCAEDEKVRDTALETVIEELFNFVKKSEQGAVEDIENNGSKPLDMCDLMCN